MRDHDPPRAARAEEVVEKRRQLVIRELGVPSIPEGPFLTEEQRVPGDRLKRAPGRLEALETLGIGFLDRTLDLEPSADRVTHLQAVEEG